MRSLRIMVIGKVQGVYYRASSKQKALELDIKGFVQNMDNGNVYLEIEGTEINIDNMIAWCKLGPARAKVDEVNIEETVFKGFESFEIKEFKN